MHSVITAMALVISSGTAQRKFLHPGTPHHHDRLHSQSWYNCNHRDKSQSNLFITDVARENALTSQGYNTNLNAAEAPVTNGGTHPTPYPATAAAHNTHPPIDLLGNTHQDTPHWHTYNSSMKQPSSCQSHSCDYSTDWSQASSRHSYNTSHRFYTQKALKPHSQKVTTHRPPGSDEGHHSGLTVRLFLRIRL